jgi:hypothetical protein
MWHTLAALGIGGIIGFVICRAMQIDSTDAAFERGYREGEQSWMRLDPPPPILADVLDRVRRSM